MTTSSKHCHGLVRLLGLGPLIESVGQESAQLLLQEFEARIQSVLRKHDRLVKVSQGKYCIVLQGVQELHHAELAAAKLERVLTEPVQIIDRRLSMNFAIGIALPGEVSSKRLLQIADTALRRAYNDGCLSVVIHPQDMQDLDTPDVTLLPRLEQALDQGEFALYYQPKIAAQYNTVLGAEALVRWHDSKLKKVVGPGMFIDLVEASPLVQPLSEHLLRMAVSACSQWSQALSVAVNVAPVLLHTPAFGAVVKDSLEFFGVPSERLTLEITERGELPDRALVHLEEIRKSGVKISIDDFGTGQCSLSYFRDLPADELKIDMTFVRAMSTSRKDRAIVHSCIELAHDCGMQVVAEGVEDAATVDRLVSLGCDVLQGFWFGRPLPQQEFEQNHLAGLMMGKEPDHFSTLLSS